MIIVLIAMALFLGAYALVTGVLRIGYAVILLLSCARREQDHWEDE